MARHLGLNDAAGSIDDIEALFSRLVGSGDVQDYHNETPDNTSIDRSRRATFGANFSLAAKNGHVFPNQSGNTFWIPEYFGPPTPEGWGRWQYPSWNGWTTGDTDQVRLSYNYPIRLNSHDRIPVWNLARFISVLVPNGGINYNAWYSVSLPESLKIHCQIAKDSYIKDWCVCAFGPLQQKYQNSSWEAPFFEPNVDTLPSIVDSAVSVDGLTLYVRINQSIANQLMQGFYLHLVMYMNSKDTAIEDQAIHFSVPNTSIAIPAIIQPIKTYFLDALAGDIKCADLVVCDRANNDAFYDGTYGAFNNNRWYQPIHPDIAGPLQNSILNIIINDGKYDVEYSHTPTQNNLTYTDYHKLLAVRHGSTSALNGVYIDAEPTTAAFKHIAASAPNINRQLANKGNQADEFTELRQYLLTPLNSLITKARLHAYNNPLVNLIASLAQIADIGVSSNLATVFSDDANATNLLTYLRDDLLRTQQESISIDDTCKSAASLTLLDVSPYGTLFKPSYRYYESEIEFFFNDRNACTGAVGNLGSNRLGLDYTLRLNLEYVNGSKLIKDIFITASNFYLSGEEYNRRLLEGRTITGYFNQDTLENMNQFRLHGYSGVIPDLSATLSRVLSTRVVSPDDSTQMTEEQFRKYWSDRGLSTPQIDEKVQEFLDEGNVFLVIDLSQMPNKFVGINDVGITMARLTSANLDRWVAWSHESNGVTSGDGVHPALANDRSDSFTLAVNGLSTGDLERGTFDASSWQSSYAPTGWTLLANRWSMPLPRDIQGIVRVRIMSPRTMRTKVHIAIGESVLSSITVSLAANESSTVSFPLSRHIYGDADLMVVSEAPIYLALDGNDECYYYINNTWSGHSGLLLASVPTADDLYELVKVNQKIAFASSSASGVWIKLLDTSFGSIKVNVFAGNTPPIFDDNLQGDIVLDANTLVVGDWFYIDTDSLTNNCVVLRSSNANFQVAVQSSLQQILIDDNQIINGGIYLESIVAEPVEFCGSFLRSDSLNNQFFGAPNDQRTYIGPNKQSAIYSIREFWSFKPRFSEINHGLTIYPRAIFDGLSWRYAPRVRDAYCRVKTIEDGEIVDYGVTKIPASTIWQVRNLQISTLNDRFDTIDTAVGDPQYVNEINWSSSAPDFGQTGDSMAFRIMGQFIPLYNDNYTLKVVLSGYIRIWLDDTIILDALTTRQELETLEVVLGTLSTDQSYDFVIEYFNETNTQSDLSVYWKPDATTYGLLNYTTAVYNTAQPIVITSNLVEGIAVMAIGATTAEVSGPDCGLPPSDNISMRYRA